MPRGARHNWTMFVLNNRDETDIRLLIGLWVRQKTRGFTKTPNWSFKLMKEGEYFESVKFIISLLPAALTSIINKQVL